MLYFQFSKKNLQMKNRNLLFLAILVLTTVLTSCKKETCQSVTVVQDCTGTYLRCDGKDYQVCNLEKVFSFADGAVVTATFKKLSVCKGSANDVFVCLMLHPSEGWVEVCEIAQ